MGHKALRCVARVEETAGVLSRALTGGSHVEICENDGLMTLVERYKSRNTGTDLKQVTGLGWLRATCTGTKGTDKIRETLMVIGMNQWRQPCYTAQLFDLSDWMDNMKLELTSRPRTAYLCAAQTKLLNILYKMRHPYNMTKRKKVFHNDLKPSFE